MVLWKSKLAGGLDVKLKSQFGYPRWVRSVEAC